MTKYYKRIKVTGTNNEETLKDILTSTEEEPKKIIALWFTEYTAAENTDAIIRAYVEREKIVDFDLQHFQLEFDSSARQSLPRLEIDMDLPVGQTLSVGHVNGATLSNIEFVVEYEKAA